MKEYLSVCGYDDSEVYIPDDEKCDSCDWMEERLELVEECCEDNKDSIAYLQYEIDNFDTGDKHFTFIQDTASVSWMIAHGLNKYPSVTIVDSAGTQVEGDVDYISQNVVVVSFSAPFSGKAFLN